MGVETPEQEHPRDSFGGSTERYLTQPLAHRPISWENKRTIGRPKVNLLMNLLINSLIH